MRASWAVSRKMLRNSSFSGRPFSVGQRLAYPGEDQLADPLDLDQPRLLGPARLGAGTHDLQLMPRLRRRPTLAQQALGDAGPKLTEPDQHRGHLQAPRRPTALAAVVVVEHRGDHGNQRRQLTQSPTTPDKIVRASFRSRYSGPRIFPSSSRSCRRLAQLRVSALSSDLIESSRAATSASSGETQLS